MRKPEALMVFAAGFGTRMGALTADRPKPLVEVAGQCLIDRALDVAQDAAANPIVVNLHYKGDMLARHLAGRKLLLSWEIDEILETGGGLRNALPLLGGETVLTLNSDAVWTGQNPLTQLQAGWSEATMDALLLIAPVDAVRGHSGHPDFSLDANGRIRRYSKGDSAGFVYLGAQIIRTGRLPSIKDRAFSMWRLWEPMIAEGRAYGLIHRGGWCDVGHPGGIREAELLLAEAPHV